MRHFPDYSSGAGKVLIFARLDETRDKAAEIAGPMAAGKLEMIRWRDVQRLEIRNALEVLKPTGVASGLAPLAKLNEASDEKAGKIGLADFAQY